MPWFSLRPRDPADPRWPLPHSPTVTVQAADAREARARAAEAYPSAPFGTPASPVPDGSASIHHDPDALVVEEVGPPATAPGGAAR
ncbi:hypothetical protein [uncultured Methylobacterium sp.]|jgi:hypothetical protein|uniref:hypothetical protein n=1 Tax=uncultured Methylobacterium sp. TaxID=157278 RepID=UPI00262965CC|nr:hypothetical protein [uncultured Methylobacterium sp.]